MRRILIIALHLIFIMFLAGLVSAEGQVRKANPPSQAEQVAPAQPAPVANTTMAGKPPESSNTDQAGGHNGGGKDVIKDISLIWMLICCFIMIFMQAGFAMVGTGFTRAKNAGHTIGMNLMVVVFAVLGYFIAGYAIQTGTRGFLLFSGPYDSPTMIIILSRIVYLNIAATIPIGAMAERWTFKSFVIYGFFISMITYPLYAKWVWDGGWLSQLGTNFGLGHGVLDFAGSSVVHMVGGVSALAGAAALGPRMGKFKADGTPNAIPGHHIPMAIIGCLILFFGWFGFNSGSTLVGGDLRMGVIAVNTMLAAVAASFSSTCYMSFFYGKPDLSLSANGLLGGLVAISGPCAFVSPLGALFIGLIAGILCCVSVFFVERRLKIDDPIGAVSVHGTCGAWGLIALGLLANGTYGDGLNNVPGAVKGLFYGGSLQFLAEVVGVMVNFIFVFIVMYAFFRILDKITPLRVSEEVEFEGLDQNELSVTAYPEFSIKARR